MKKEEFCIVALVNRVKGGDDAMKIEMKDFAFVFVDLIISHYVEQRMPTVTIFGFTFFTGWLFLALFLIYVIWKYRREKLKKQIKDEILKELGFKG
ncbi:hypothetical protein ABET52_12010 [Saccharococcus caldoxylosilyticus]|uniref:hypothetical protein n=1 Tax=Saccharococcus caldoxylosilyticus TaxID=81408 RepID=UPI003D3503E7